MPHIGIFCPPVSGHINPMAAVGRALEARRHRVTFFQIPGLEERIGREGLGYYPLGNSTSSGDLANAVKSLGSRQGLSALYYTLQCGRRLAQITCEFGPAAVKRAGVDLLLVDDNEPAGGSVAEHLGLPFVNIGSIPLYREASVPPHFVPWTYAQTRIRSIQNWLAYSTFEALVRPLQGLINRYRSEWKLSPVRRPQDTLSPYAQISQLVKDLDWPRQNLSPHLHYLGALCDRDRPPVSFPFERLDGKPLIYASLGTILNQNPVRFRAIAAACERLNVQLVITTGGGPIPELEPHPSRLVVKYAPQLELLNRAALCITHAGLNTVMESLSSGVPMVCIPFINDQPAVSARVRWVGAGEVIPAAQLTPSRLRTLIGRVLASEEYRKAAQAITSRVRQAGGAERAADVIAEVLNGRNSVPARAAGANA